MVRITEAALDDVPQLCALLSALFTQESNFQPDSAKQTAALRLIMQNPEFGQILVARDDSNVLGMVSLLYTISAAHGGSTAILEDLVVHSSHRGKGIGSTLLRRAIARAHSCGSAQITLLTDRSNQTAIRLYKSHGFACSRHKVMRLFLDR